MITPPHFALPVERIRCRDLPNDSAPSFALCTGTECKFVNRVCTSSRFHGSLRKPVLTILGQQCQSLRGRGGIKSYATSLKRRDLLFLFPCRYVHLSPQTCD